MKLLKEARDLAEQHWQPGRCKDEAFARVLAAYDAASQPVAGEAVAYRFKGGANVWHPVSEGAPIESDRNRVEYAYTTPVPPAVVVPDRCSMSGELDQGTRIYNNGWNKCRDAVLRLNKRESGK